MPKMRYFFGIKFAKISEICFF